MMCRTMHNSVEEVQANIAPSDTIMPSGWAIIYRTVTTRTTKSENARVFVAPCTATNCPGNIIGVDAVVVRISELFQLNYVS